jgi:hypothetical protein
MKKLTTAGLVAVALLGTSTIASAQVVCAIPLIVAGIITSQTENRELTQKEAMWCGLYHEPQPVKKVKKVKKSKKKAM